MLHLVSDVNADGRVIDGLRRRHPALDLVRAQDVGLDETDDPAILEWAAQEGRIVLSHDFNTMIGDAYDRVKHGQPMPGMFVLRDGFTVGQWIEAILIMEFCSEQNEWRDQVVYLPL